MDKPSDGHFALGNAFVRKKEFDAALQHFAVSAYYHEPYASRSKMQIGTILLIRGDLTEAHAKLREALRDNPRLEEEIAELCFDRGGERTAAAVLSEKQRTRARRLRAGSLGK